MKQNFELMAKYNQWMNQRIYHTLEGLSPAQLNADRGAFFGSIIGTLNHILVGDTIWLKRFSKHTSQFSSLNYVHSLFCPSALSEIIYADLGPLSEARSKMDEAIINFTHEASEQDYAFELSYTNTKGLAFKKQFGALVQHFFNHQSHHRGQVTTLLNQIEIDVGVTDLLALIPDSDKT